jgi:hypothetical protein
MCSVDSFRPVQSLLCGCRGPFLRVERPDQGIINYIANEWSSTSIQPLCLHSLKRDITFKIDHKRPLTLGGSLICT